ncbi:MAG: hypothetical protein R6V44_14530 [Paracoccaceae bacterium]
MSGLFWDPLVWLAAALLLMAAEALAAGFFLLGFGIGAGLTAGALFFAEPWIRSLPEPTLMLASGWIAASLVAWVVLWALFGRRSDRRGGDDVNDFRNSG